MGQIIRRLRKERNLTQEELAEQLNITYQAVSRWENGTGMPDISQVVPLTNVLGVSVDVLFGTSGNNVDEEVENFIREHHRKRSNKTEVISDFTYHKECCEDVQKILTTYPNNYKLLACSLDSMVTLLWDYWDDRFTNQLPNREVEAKALQNECIRQANIIFHHCSNIEYLDLAHRRMVSVYRIMGEYEKAEEHAKQIVDFSGFQLAVVYDDMGRIEEAMMQYSRTLYMKLIQLAPILPALGYLYRKQGKFEEAYTCYRLQTDIFERITENNDDSEPYHMNLSHNLSYDWCAAVCMELGRTDEAMDWLEKWIGFEQKAAEKYNINKTSKLPYFYGLDFTSHSESFPREKRITSSLEWDVFDPIRQSERFKKILASAKAFEMDK